MEDVKMFRNKRILLISSISIIELFLRSNIFVLNVNAQTIDNTINYTVKKGDTFYLLGLRFNSSINDI